MTRRQLEAAVWKFTHADYKGVYQGKKSILVYRANEGTTLVAIADLPDAELERRLPKVACSKCGRGLTDGECYQWAASGLPPSRLACSKHLAAVRKAHVSAVKETP